MTLQMALQTTELVSPPGRSGQSPAAAAEGFSLGWFYFKNVCLFLHSFFEKQLVEHTTNMAKNTPAITPFLNASEILCFPLVLIIKCFSLSYSGEVENVSRLF